MRFFRRNAETLNERLLREAGLTQPHAGGAAELEQDAGEYAVHASRIDGDYWETEAHPL